MLSPFDQLLGNVLPPEPVLALRRRTRFVPRIRRRVQRKPRAGRRPGSREPLPRATPSFYVRSVAPSVLRARGCRAGRRRAFGIVVLAFGKPDYDGHSYGTLTFADRFASNRQITAAMEAFAQGYVHCLPHRSRAHIVLARGTSNYLPDVPSTYGAGWRWARETVGFARFLRRAGLGARVSSAAADDAEPAWNPGFARTRDFFRGYRAYRPGHVLYDYGSLDGGVGAIWSARQVWFVTAGMEYARALPEIYNAEMAREWARMSRIAVRRWGRPLHFAGLMTEHTAGCGCGFRPSEAHRALVLDLRRSPGTWVRRLAALTNIK